MSNALNSFFNTSDNQDTTAGARNLAGTAQLTNLSADLANNILKAVESDFDTFKELFAKSKHEHGAMDELITRTYDLSTVDTDFLKLLDEATLDSMLKSQQSKRSRSKGKTMTMDNYKAMMVGAIAENLIRLASGKTKAAVGARRFAGSLEYNAAQLEELLNDQEKLRKEIRNVQSKKSIMKSKEGFSEDDERWLQLIVAEDTLKGLRTDIKTVVVDETKDKLADLLNGADVATMKNSDAKKLLEQIMALTADKGVE